MDAFGYQYLIGGAIFAYGLSVAWRHGYVRPFQGGLRNLSFLLLAFLGFMAVQGYLQYAPMETAAPGSYQGGYERSQRLGTLLDYAVMVGYFAAILFVGTWFGRHQRTVRDFFFGGQRFSWVWISASLVATIVGSYSFVKYSRIAFDYGIASTQTYLNDWIWMPLFLFGWLPILYFSRITSVPEYFERRFDRKVRLWVTVSLVVYLVGYVGVNLFTMGKALNILVGWPVPLAALVVAAISATYVTSGGQTSVIMTDMLQGVMLVGTGLLVLVLGISELGGFTDFWGHLPRGHRLAFANFNEDPSYNSVGIFWQDGIANTAMFYFLNQGAMMRFLAARSVQDARRAAMIVPVVLMPVAAVVVASGGWVARALAHAGILPPDIPSDEAFFVATDFLARPGIFGLVMAALTAALMSTVDTLITAVAAVAVNDVYRPYIRPNADEKQLLRVARVTSLSVAVVGVLLVPVFMSFDSIYAAHGAFTASVTPPLVVTMLLSIFWRRFTRDAALWTIFGGSLVILASIFFPALIAPLAHGVPAQEIGDGWFEGAKQYKFMRALLGILASAVIGIVVSLVTRPQQGVETSGLVWGSIQEALRRFKGGEGSELPGAFKRHRARCGSASIAHPRRGAAELDGAILRGAFARQIQAEVGEVLYLCDARWWVGSLASAHVYVAEIREDVEDDVVVEEAVWSALGSARDVKLLRLY